MSLLWTTETSKTYKVDPSGHLISIELDFDYQGAKAEQPNHFDSMRATKIPMKSGSFTGDVAVGGSCNAFQVTINPHCNGTHTESSWHLNQKGLPPYKIIDRPFYLAKLISVTPSKDLGEDTYSVPLSSFDTVITRKQIATHLKDVEEIEGLVIRTLPNLETKKIATWGKDFPGAFLSYEAAKYISGLGIKHLIIDTPSIDKSNDEGRLLAHRTFLKDDTTTVSEMAYIPNSLQDGIFALRICAAPVNLDAFTSSIYLHPIHEENNERAL